MSLASAIHSIDKLDAEIGAEQAINVIPGTGLTPKSPESEYRLLTSNQARAGGLHYLRLTVPINRVYKVYAVTLNSDNNADYGRYELTTAYGLDMPLGTVALANVLYWYELMGDRAPWVLRTGDYLQIVANSAGAGGSIRLRIIYTDIEV